MPTTSSIAILLLGLSSVQEGKPAPAAEHGDGSVAAERSAGLSGLADEAIQAIQRFRVPDGFRVELFASEPLLANPVAFCFDVFGRVYVAETFRHSKGVTDIRSHMNWLEDDIAIKTVADRVAMFRKHEGDDGLASGYSVETERVSRIIDKDGDGVADGSVVFSGDLTDPAVGIGAGVLARPMDGVGGTELWFTCIPDVWRMFDSDGDGVAESRTSQSEGYGLRVALLGHDLHGLTLGPDGRIYFSIGDRGFNITTAEGQELIRYGTGAVFRCELDGSGLEIFCDGLRNPQELVFDEQGNLFTLDNNSDGGDQARWTWLLKGSDTGWRQAYQWVGEPTSRGPWNEELLWKPFSPEQPAYVLPPIANFTSGPSGLTIYPGTGFGEEWRGKFFVCDFRGNPGYSGIYAYDNEVQGAGFRLGKTEEFVWDTLPTDVDFGLDGNLYWSDWVSGWNQTGKGRLYRMVPEGRDAAEEAAIADTRATLLRLAAEGGSGNGIEGSRDASLSAASGYMDEELVELFSHRDRRVRQEAQLALAHRALNEPDQVEGQRHMVPVLKRLQEPAISERGRTARLHAIWTVWHVARRSTALGESLPKHLTGLLFDEDSEVVAQACRVFGDLGWQPAGRRIPQLLIHDSPRVRLFAAQALGGIGLAETSTAGLFELLDTSAATDPWLRHAAIHALERLGNPGDLHAQLGHPAEHVRRAVAVVLRRWKDEAIAALLSDPSGSVRAEAARAIFDAGISGGMDELAAFLGSAPEETDHLTWRRAVQACREVATEESARLLADFAHSTRGPASVRAEAMRVLASWTVPQTRDGILQDHRPLPGGDPAHLDALRTHPLLSRATVTAMAQESDAKGRAALARALVKLHGVAPGADTAAGLADLAGSDAFRDGPRRDALKVLLVHAPESTEAQATLRAALESVGSPLRAQAFGMLPASQAAQRLVQAAREGSLGDRAEAIKILSALRGPEAARAYAVLGAELVAASDPTLVDWLEGADGHGDSSVQGMQAALLTSWSTAREQGDALAGWRMCLDGGDAETGSRIFATKAETSCTKCHIVGGAGGSEAGPVLDTVGDRLDPDALLRSIVTPNAEIAEGFQSWILMADGEAFAGRIIEETGDLVLLETTKKEQLEFTPDEIEARKRDVSAMPGDIATHLSRREIQDLVAYLRGLQAPGNAPR
ncbi:MAG: quinoprotein glucose dehydrogenase [Planctomycetota bacterium]|jgi:quinoprotein glucose dehydrogenase